MELNPLKWFDQNQAPESNKKPIAAPAATDVQTFNAALESNAHASDGPSATPVQQLRAQDEERELAQQRYFEADARERNNQADPGQVVRSEVRPSEHWLAMKKIMNG